ncbi:MAG TPA: tetratricopeptide repeat protein [Thermoanaerobaculia bacterium]|nr:tetratricopeptide repeat protein [Thermoanaerobaculia bacterium]
MLSDHPNVQDWEGFLTSPFRPGHTARNAKILRHLLAACVVCRDRLQAMGWPGERLERLLYLPGGEAVTPMNGYDYGQAFARAERSVSDFLAEAPLPPVSPDLLLEELDQAPRERRAVMVREERFAYPRIVTPLIERSHAVRYSDPEEMLFWAAAARELAQRCTPEATGNEARLSDLRARVWEQVASLHTFQRRFDEAIAKLSGAAEVYRQIGESHALARTLVQEAIACLYAGNPETAVGLLNQAIPLIDHEGDPHLLMAACHNLIRCYIDLDQPELALSIYSETRNLYKEFSDSLIQLRAGWQEGQLLRDLGHLRAAETVLLRAREGFIERGLMYEAAVVSLDLAALYTKLRSTDDLRQTVAATVPIFRALRVDREALASLLQLQQVADQEHRAMELIRFLNARIEPNAERGTLR